MDRTEYFPLMRKPSTSAFTLVELLTVLAIIVVITSLVVSVGGYVQKKAALSRATGELHMLESACAAYKGDNGSFPRDVPTTGVSVTDVISPKVDFLPGDAKYAASSLFLYKELSGDKSTTGDTEAGAQSQSGQPNGIPDFGQPRYLKDIETGRLLKATKNPATKTIISVQYIQDPFGSPYAYSTSAAKDEQDYQTKLLTATPGKTPPVRPAGSALHGFNSGSYDLWSTGGSPIKGNPTTPAAKELEWARWVKNW